MAGEQLALWQFRASQLAASLASRTQRRRRTVVGTALANAFVAKLALASAAAVATGGVVFAAESGHWPGGSPIYLVAPHTSAAARPSTAPRRIAVPRATAEPTDVPPLTAPPSSADEPGTPVGTPSESQVPKPTRTHPTGRATTPRGLARGHGKGAPGSRGHRYGQLPGHGKTHPKNRAHGRRSAPAHGTPMRT